MKTILNWWYSLALPRRAFASSPQERERERYARLTAGLLLLISCLFLPVAPIMLFFSPASPSSPPIGVALICLLIISWITGRMGHQIFSASCLIVLIFLGATGPLLTNQFSASLTPLFSEFTIAVVLAGSLMPPSAALIAGAVSCLDIGLVNFFALNMNTYTQGDRLHLLAVNTLSLTLMVPISIQILISVIVFVIMRNLLTAIRRADRAEEIVSLQKAIAEHERTRTSEQRQLEESLERIAEVHARIANGDYNARISLNDGNVLWSIAVPLNNLLNRLQGWKNDSDGLLVTRQAADYIAKQLRFFAMTDHRQSLPLTGTPLDPVIVEMNKLLAVQTKGSTYL